MELIKMDEKIARAFSEIKKEINTMNISYMETLTKRIFEIIEKHLNEIN